MALKDFLKNHKKKLIAAPLVAATIIGTWGGNEGVAPFFNKKVGTSGGINIGFYTEYTPGSEFYGIDLGILRSNEGGTINGIAVAVANRHKPDIDTQKLGKLNGIEVGLLNIPALKENSNDNHRPEIINGMQIGMVNSATAGNVFQLGIYNYNEEEGGYPDYSGIGLNYDFAGDEE